jgi:hypothetical protein
VAAAAAAGMLLDSGAGGQKGVAPGCTAGATSCHQLRPSWWAGAAAKARARARARGRRRARAGLPSRGQSPGVCAM